MLDKIKAALQIAGNVFDTELTDLMNAAIIDLNIAGVDAESIVTTTTDPIVTRAIISYVAYQFELVHGSIERSEAMKKAYDEQKSQLGMATGYTKWSDET